MVLYHGTSVIIQELDLSKGRLRTDFGKGYSPTEVVESVE
ncbi:MAG: DUF3990 domain-containing protein [Defluviitaleaceae bacterium]|nr:DUF3990 domain-containing protein [Defluviitaleaceae bacterium]